MNVDEYYSADRLSVPKSTLATFAAVIGGGLFSLVFWAALKTTHLPAFGGSNVSRALATAGATILIVVIAFLSFMWIRDGHVDARPPLWRKWSTYVISYLSPAALVSAVLSIPLSATKLYLDGLTIDQGFRTQYFTRLTSSWQLHDMNYIDIPPYYPAVWFWLGGRFANAFGLAGWEAYQPWAIVSISMVTCALVPLWQWICGSLPVATGIALVNTAIFLVMSAEEPYAGVVAVGAPLAAVMINRALEGSKFAIGFLILYLGLSAATYTVVTAAITFSIIIIVAISTFMDKRILKPFIVLAIIGVGSVLISLLSWGPYFLSILRGAPVARATATHYLPFEGVQVPLPMFSPTLIGGLCLIGVGYLLFRFADPDVRNLAVTLSVTYVWIVASMVTSLTGNTLLGFRLDILVALILATAGVLGIAEFRLNGIREYLPLAFSSENNRDLQVKISGIMLAVVAFAGVSYAQSIPTRNHTAIDLAYTDTDGNGVRADKFPADSTKYFQEIDSYIQGHGYSPSDTIVLSDAHSFLNLYPYYGFQALTSHYANPLGQFEERNSFIEQLATKSHDELKDPAKFQAALDESPWRGPEVFIFRGAVDDSEGKWKYDISEDIYPNDPNVRFRGVYFNPDSFKGWDIKQIGPFVVVVKPLT